MNENSKKMPEKVLVFWFFFFLSVFEKPHWRNPSSQMIFLLMFFSVKAD